MLVQEDHLIPAKQNGNTDRDNLVIACYPCNKLKGAFVPEMSYTGTNKEQYIDAVRDEIMKRRSKNMQDFVSWTRGEPPIS